MRALPPPTEIPPATALMTAANLYSLDRAGRAAELERRLLACRAAHPDAPPALAELMEAASAALAAPALHGGWLALAAVDYARSLTRAARRPAGPALRLPRPGETLDDPEAMPEAAE